MTQHGEENKEWLSNNGFEWDKEARMYWSRHFQVMVSLEMVEYSYHEAFVKHVNKVLKNAQKRS